MRIDPGEVSARVKAKLRDAQNHYGKSNEEAFQSFDDAVTIAKQAEDSALVMATWQEIANIVNGRQPQEPAQPAVTGAEHETVKGLDKLQRYIDQAQASAEPPPPPDPLWAPPPPPPPPPRPAFDGKGRPVFSGKGRPVPSGGGKGSTSGKPPDKKGWFRRIFGD